jgi:hypothetical protein
MADLLSACNLEQCFLVAKDVELLPKLAADIIRKDCFMLILGLLELAKTIIGKFH